MTKACSQYRQVARLHIDSLNTGFLSTLGIDFLEILYECIDKTPGCFVLTIYHDDDLVGFVAGFTSPIAIMPKLLRRLPQVCLALLPHVFKKTSLLTIQKYIRSRIVKAEATSSANSEFRLELFSIAVARSARRMGIARKLYEQFQHRAKSIGYEGFKVYVGQELTIAQEFYAAMGAKKLGLFKSRADNLSIVYVHNI